MTRILLDTDLGMGAPGSDIDDGFALALALADPELELDAVTTVAGNTSVANATALSVALLHRLGRPDIPVFAGAATRLAHAGRPAPSRHPLPDAVAGGAPRPGYAAVELARRVTAEPGRLTVVAIGPFTNVALALALEPRFASSVAEIVVMGGVYLGQTHLTGLPGEFNFWSDPEAAAIVLSSGARVRCVGLDVTERVRFDRDRAAALRSSGSAFGRLAGEAAEQWIDVLARRHPDDPVHRDSCALHDPLAVAAVARPDLLTWRDAAVEIVVDGPGRGIAVTDLLTSASAPAPNCRVAVDVDVDGFLDRFASLLASADAGSIGAPGS